MVRIVQHAPRASSSVFVEGGFGEDELRQSPSAARGPRCPAAAHYRAVSCNNGLRVFGRFRTAQTSTPYSFANASASTWVVPSGQDRLIPTVICVILRTQVLASVGRAFESWRQARSVWLIFNQVFAIKLQRLRIMRDRSQTGLKCLPSVANGCASRMVSRRIFRSESRTWLWRRRVLFLRAVCPRQRQIAERPRRLMSFALLICWEPDPHGPTLRAAENRILCRLLDKARDCLLYPVQQLRQITDARRREKRSLPIIACRF